MSFRAGDEFGGPHSSQHHEIRAPPPRRAAPGEPWDASTSTCSRRSTGWGRRRGPDEDREGGFRFGGWQAPLFDDVVGEQVRAGLADFDALLLGRTTYDLFASYWPHQEGDIAGLLNAVPKYVASRSAPELVWADSTHLGPDSGRKSCARSATVTRRST